MAKATIKTAEIVKTGKAPSGDECRVTVESYTTGTETRKQIRVEVVGEPDKVRVYDIVYLDQILSMVR